MRKLWFILGLSLPLMTGAAIEVFGFGVGFNPPTIAGTHRVGPAAVGTLTVEASGPNPCDTTCTLTWTFNGSCGATQLGNANIVDDVTTQEKIDLFRSSDAQTVAATITGTPALIGMAPAFAACYSQTVIAIELTTTTKPGTKTTNVWTGEIVVLGLAS